MEHADPIVTVTRLLRHDTYDLRMYCPALRARATVYMTPMGIWCDDDARQHALDWIELHAENDRLRLITADWLRDEYGRLLGDLQDLRSGETLTSYLMSVKAAKRRPHHVMDVMYVLASAPEVDEC
jgi:hypothetical protein